MADLAPIIRRFAEHEFMVRYLYARDSEFRVICEDYLAARRALAHWNDDRNKAEDYRQLVGDLESEILEHLDNSRRHIGRPPAGRHQ